MVIPIKIHYNTNMQLITIFRLLSNLSMLICKTKLFVFCQRKRHKDVYSNQNSINYNANMLQYAAN